MELGYKGKVVGITGAASQKGIGFAIAKQMLQEGASVFICDLKQEAVDEAVAALSEFGTAKGYAADVSSETAVANLFDCAMRDFGHVDVFVSNAGIYPQSALMDMTVAQWDTVMGINLRSVFLCAKNAFRCMKDHGGVIINAASYAAVISSAGSGAYAATKSAVYSLTKTLAAELAPWNIRVCGFIPGVIHTGMTSALVDQKGDQMVSQIALHRLGKPSDVAQAVAFLASDAASYITGTFVEISGGKLCVQNPDYAYAKKEAEENA